MAKKINSKKINDRNRWAKLSIKDIPFPLRGSTASMAKQTEMAKKDNLEHIATAARLDEMVKSGKLIPLPENDLIKINKGPKGIAPERQYCLPVARKFLLDMAEACRKFNQDFEPLMINSAVRPLDYQKELQKKNSNASSKSSHPTGATFDIAYNANDAGYKGMSQVQLDWTQKYLIEMEKKGLIEATQERLQTVFHIMVFEDYLKAGK